MADYDNRDEILGGGYGGGGGGGACRIINTKPLFVKHNRRDNLSFFFFTVFTKKTALAYHSLISNLNSSCGLTSGED